MNRHKKKWCYIFLLVLAVVWIPISEAQSDDKIGVIFVLHGGMDEYHDQYLWDAAVQMFSYDPNHPVYKFVIWNSAMWGGSCKRNLGKTLSGNTTLNMKELEELIPFTPSLTSNLQT